MREPCSAVAERIARYAEKLGCEVESISSSSLSDSCYLQLAFRKTRTEWGRSLPCLMCVKIRISDHELPEMYEDKYGYTHFEVGEWQGTHYDNQNSWIDCIEWLAEEMSVALPKRAEKLVRRRDRKRKIASASQLYGVS